MTFWTCKGMAGTAEGDLPCLRLNSVNKSLFYYLYTQEFLNEVLEHTIKCFRELVDLLANRPSPSDRISRISDPTLTETNFSDQKRPVVKEILLGPARNEPKTMFTNAHQRITLGQRKLDMLKRTNTLKRIHQWRNSVNFLDLGGPWQDLSKTLILKFLLLIHLFYFLVLHFSSFSVFVGASFNSCCSVTHA